MSLTYQQIVSQLVQYLTQSDKNLENLLVRIQVDPQLQSDPNLKANLNKYLTNARLNLDKTITSMKIAETNLMQTQPLTVPTVTATLQSGEISSFPLTGFQ